jgi:hypothetical protein
VVSAVGLAEALFFIGYFFYEKRHERLNLFSGAFVLRALALSLALACLVATLITSDLAEAFIVFDRMSLPVVVLFAMQQAALLGTKKPKDAPQEPGQAGRRLRAERRYEG